MKEKVQQLVDKLTTERDEARVQLDLGDGDAHDDWQKAEDKWLNLQLRLKQAGLNLTEKAGVMLEEFESELAELKEEASQKAWQMNLKAHEELHDLGEDVDKLQHKISDKVEDIRLELMDELHELGEEISGLYAKLRGRLPKSSND